MTENEELTETGKMTEEASENAQEMLKESETDAVTEAGENDNPEIAENGNPDADDAYTPEPETGKGKRKEKKPGNTGKGIAIGCGISLLVVLLLIGGLLLAAARLFPGLFPQKTRTVSEAPANNTLDIAKITQKMGVIQGIIEEGFLFEEDPEKVETGIYQGMMAGLDDPYSVYYDQESLKDLQEDTSGEYSGIGAMIQQDAAAGTLTIVRVFDGSPAQEAGVKVGDIIYKVDDVYASDVDFDILVSHHIKGPEGTVVTIIFYRDGEEVTLPITRRKIDTPTVEFEMLDNQIGYIEVSQFAATTYDSFVNAIESLRKDGAKGLVIDLRDNPGGVFETSIEMADYLLPDGLITYTADKNGEGAKYYSDDHHSLELPIVILINENSASASEVFTGAMMDHNAATVIGTKSFGKGIVQNIIPLNDGSAIKITVEHYYTPNGTDLHGEGLKPDMEVELSEECKAYGDENDNQLEEACKLLK